MGKIALALLFVLAVLASLFYFLGPGDAVDTLEPLDRLAREERADDLRVAPVDDELEPVEVEESSAARSEAVEPAVAAESPEAHPRSQVLGKLEDVNGRPLPDVVVTMNSVGMRWIERELHPEDIPKFRAESDARGNFELDVPLPTSDWISIDYSGGEFFVHAGREFGLAGGRNEKPLRPGVNDLGTIVLLSAGAFEGRVLDESGLPIEGARVRLDGVFPGGYSVGGNADTTGSYRVGGAPGGRYAVEALAKGYESAARSGVTVEDGQVTPSIDFTLKRAHRISGRVVDEQGAPLAKVRLWGWPESGGQGAGARSADDGSFVVYLPQNEPYTLGAELKGYESIHDGRQGGFYEPGTSDIELVLKLPQLVSYRVLDAHTEQPVERFGLRILRVRLDNGTTSSSADDDPGRLGEHEGGVLQAPGDPRYDDYTIHAPGYAPQRGRVALDEEGVLAMTLRLMPAGTLRGRLVSRGEALASPAIQLSADRVPLKPNVTTGEDDIFSSDWGSDLDEFAGRRQQFQGRADGRFEIADLAAGTYEIALTSTTCAPLTIERIVIESGRVTDLGDVEAHAPGAIHGLIVLDGGASPAGLSVALGDEYFPDDETSRRTDLNGYFAFGDLPEGTHHLWVDPKPGLLLSGAALVVELARSEVKDLRLDLSERLACTLEVRVLVGGRAVEGLNVLASVPQAQRKDYRLGSTDSNGLAVGDVPGQGVATVSVQSRTRIGLGVQVEQQLAPATRPRVELALEAGELTLLIPEEHKPSLFGQRLSVCRANDDGEFLRYAGVSLHGIEIEVSDGQARLELGLLAPGRHRFELKSGTQTLVGLVEVTAGARATCRLEL